MEHDLPHCLGVRLLVGPEYGVLSPPPARERHVLPKMFDITSPCVKMAAVSGLVSNVSKLGQVLFAFRHRTHDDSANARSTRACEGLDRNVPSGGARQNDYRHDSRRRIAGLLR